MKRFLLRNVAFALLIFVSSVVWASGEMRTAAEALVNEKAKLYRAIGENDLSEVKSRYSELVKNENLLSWDYDGSPNPLYYAIFRSNVEVVDFFLDFPIANKWLKEKNEYGETTIHLIARYSDFGLLKKIMAISDMDGLLNEKDKDGYTPIHAAINQRRIESVRFLLRYPQVQANMATKTIHGYTLLHSAIFSDEIDIVKVFFETPAARALIFEKDIQGNTVLDIATSIFAFDDQILTFLLSLPEVFQLISLRHSNGGNAFHRSRPEAFLAMARFLENHPQYLHLLKVRDIAGSNPLVYLNVNHPRLDLSKFFELKHFEALLQEKDNRGYNFVHQSVELSGLSKVIQIAKLAKNPKKLFEAPDNQGTSPLGLSVKLGRTAIVGALMAEGVDFENVLIDHKKVSAIEYLTQNLTGVDALERVELLQFLLSRPAEESHSSGWSGL